jgi:RNA polymerase-binding transcription factor DksA
MATKKTAPKKVEAKKTIKVVAKSAPKKAAAKVATKPVVKKAASKPVAKKVAAKPAPKKAASKPVAKKVAAKPVVKKAASKPVAKKVAAKPAPKKAASNPVAKKVTAKPAAKKVAKVVAKPVAKKAASKPVAKKVAVKPAPKKAAKVVAKQVAKKVAAKVVAKPVAKKVAVKPAPKKAAKVVAKPVAKKAAKVVAKPVAKKEPVKVAPKVVEKKVAAKVEKPVKPVKPAKAAPTKTVIANNSIPKKSDVFKTTTFGVANLKNDTGKVIAHRKTADLKRKNNDFGEVKKSEIEYTRSILDMVPDVSKTSYRYSDDDLQEFREIIERKLDTAKAELQYLQGVIMRKDESGTEDTENKYQNMEDGSASMDREQFNQLAGRQVTFISHLEQALVRIENKTYGICRETGKLIDKARLRAVPHATLSIEAKNAKK